MQNPIKIKIRAKKLGVLLRDARSRLGKSREECAQAIGVSPAQLQDYELGVSSPSLPEVEVLAMYLDVPLDHFWGDKTLSEAGREAGNLDLEHLISLRQRMIGALIRQARTDASLSLAELAGSLGLSAEEFEAIERGDSPIALPVLESLSALIDRPIRDFQDKHGPVGVWVEQQRALQAFLELSPEMQVFVSKPINQPYLALAQRLSEMSVDKLRAVGEGILEITL